jgi:hypothetical protein
MRYTVFELNDDYGREASGLSLEEAFARLMALAECDYSFARDGSEMRLLFLRRNPLPDMPFPDEKLMDFLNPDFRSSNTANAEARREIMEQMIEHGLGRYCVVPDERFLAEKAKYFERA